MEDLIFTSDTHIARVHVMKTEAGLYRGYVYLRRTNDPQQGEQPYQTDLDRERQDQARDDAKALAFKLPNEYERQ